MGRSDAARPSFPVKTSLTVAERALVRPFLSSQANGRVHTVAASYGPDDGSPLRRSAERCAGEFLDLSGAGDVEAAAAVAAEAPEIFVDLMAHTTGARCVGHQTSELGRHGTARQVGSPASFNASTARARRCSEMPGLREPHELGYRRERERSGRVAVGPPSRDCRTGARSEHGCVDVESVALISHPGRCFSLTAV